MMRAAAATARLVAALEAVEQAWGERAPADPTDEDLLFVHTAHGRLRDEAVALADMWREWLDAAHVPRARGAGRQVDERREFLALQVVVALDVAEVPIATTRDGAVEQVLQAVLAHATPGRAHADLHKDVRRWVANERRLTYKGTKSRRQHR
jgi:hypothetical protein